MAMAGHLPALNIGPPAMEDAWRYDWWNCPYSEGTWALMSDLNVWKRLKWSRFGDPFVFQDRLDHLPMILMYSVVLTVLRMLFKHIVLPPLARWLGIRSKKKTEKFSYQVWLGSYYTIASAAGFYLMYTENIAYGAPFNCRRSQSIWDPYPYFASSDFFNAYYMIQAAFYLTEFAATILETRRSDFWVYLWHHFCTFALIVGSFSTWDNRFGLIIMILHDIPDIFLSWAKVFHYFGREVLSHICFILLVVSFGFFRLYMFPGLIHSAWAYGMRYREGFEWNGVNLTFLTFGLLPLHWMWYGLILRVAYKAIFANLEDCRSDSDSDGEDNKKRK